jgi:hypothetical protein
VALIPVALAAWTRSRGSSAGRRVTWALLGAYLVADVAIVLPVGLWLAVALLLVAVRWSRPQPGIERAPGAEPTLEPAPGAEPTSPAPALA